MIRLWLPTKSSEGGAQRVSPHVSQSVCLTAASVIADGRPSTLDTAQGWCQCERRAKRTVKGLCALTHV